MKDQPLNDGQAPRAAEVREQVAKMLASDAFKSAQRPSALLRYLVERTLAGEANSIKEYTLGVDALGRNASFDPRTDPIARVEASRLRGRLDSYYGAEGATDLIGVTLPKGSYVPQFSRRELQQHATASSSKRSHYALVAGALVLALVAFVAGHRLQKPLAKSAVQYHLDFNIGTDGPVASEVGVDMAISPDGAHLVFVKHEPNGTFQLYSRRLDARSATRLPGTGGARGPFISPDGRWVGFWAESRVKKTRIDGLGAPVTLCDATDLLGGWWGDNGYIVAALDVSGVLRKIPEDGGTASVALAASEDASVRRWPQVLDHNAGLIYSVLRNNGLSDIEHFNAASGKRTTLVRGATYGRYLPNGTLAYLSRGTVFVVPIDIASGKQLASPAPALKDVAYSPSFGYAQFAFARNGTLVYRRTDVGGLFAFAWLARGDAQQRLAIEPGRYQWPKISPDGQRIAYTAQDAEHTELQVYETQNAQVKRLTPGDADYGAPVWSMDGKFIVFNRYGANALLSTHPNDQTAPQLLLDDKALRIPWSMSPDGKQLAFSQMSTATGLDLWTAPIASEDHGVRVGTPQVFRNTKAFESYPSFSPDGKWLAYTSNESGAWQVYVRRYPDDGTVIQVSNPGGRIPAWSKQTNELFYETDDHRLMITEYTLKNGTLVFTKPTAWSTIQLADTGVLANFDISPDGKRVLALVPADTSALSPRRDELTVVVNFF